MVVWNGRLEAQGGAAQPFMLRDAYCRLHFDIENFEELFQPKFWAFPPKVVLWKQRRVIFQKIGVFWDALLSLSEK